MKHPHPSTLAALLSFSAIAFAMTVPCVPPTPSLIEDINVVDVVSGSIKLHQDVLIAAGKIARIADRNQISKTGIPTRVYAGGKYLIPGLWDVYVHLSYTEDELGLYLAHGVMGIRAVGANRTKIDNWQSAMESLKMLTPRIVAGPAGTAETADSPSARVSVHEEEIPMLTRVRRSLFLDWRETISNPALQFVSIDIQNAWAANRLTRPELAAQTLVAHREVYAQAEQRVRERALHGMPILAGTDTGEPYTVPGDELHRELELLVHAGLSPAAALRAATIEPARWLHLDRELGTVECGKDADLVLLDANPLTDIRNSRSIFAIFLGGRYLDRQRLDSRMTSTMRLARN